MLKGFNLSGIWLGIFLLGLGVTYILDITFSLNSFRFWLKLYPLLPILLGIDYILSSSKSSKAIVTKPDHFVAVAIIVITIIGFFGNFTPRFSRADFPNIRRFDFHGFNFSRNYHQTLRENFEIPAGIKVIKIENNIGEVKVDTRSGNSVAVTAKLRFRTHLRRNYHKNDQILSKLTGEVQGDHFVIRVTEPDEGFSIGNPIVSLTVAVPEGISVDINNNTGAVKVDNVGGDLNLEVNTGEIKVDNVARNLTIRNNFGAITVDSVRGNADISTKTGRIKVEQILGTAKVESSAGEIILDECNGPVEASVNAGHLKVNLLKAAVSTFESKMGSIEIGLPAEAGFFLNADCSMGEIHSDFPVSIKRDMAASSANGEVNGGGPLIKIQTKTGSISLRKL